MTRGKYVTDFVQSNPDFVVLSRHERLWLLVIVTMCEIKHTVCHAENGTITPELV